jgi:hypothetical protein
MDGTRDGSEQDAHMPDPLDLLEGRVDSLEKAITDGLSRIEALLRQQIQDLKSEQLKDLKENYLRLADDQRRAWDAIRELEKARNVRDGGGRVIDRIFDRAAPIAAAIVGYFLATWRHGG